MSVKVETAEQRLARLQLEEICRKHGRVIGDVIKASAPGVGWALLLFNFGGEGSLAWMSNAERADMIVMLKEFIALLEGRAIEGQVGSA